MKSLAINISPEWLKIETLTAEKAKNIVLAAFWGYFYSDREGVDNQYITLQSALYLSDRTYILTI